MALRDTFVENANVGSTSSMSSREVGEKTNSAESKRTHLTSGSSVSARVIQRGGVSARVLQRANSVSALIHDAHEAIGEPVTATIENVHVVTEFCGKVVNHPRVQVGIIALIIINAIMMGVATFDFIEENPTISNAFEITDLVFLIIFTVELAMQLIYHGYKLFLDGWLLFDFIIVVLSWALQSLQIIRAFRIFRALRLITRIKTMKNLVDALFDIMPRLGAVSALLSLIFYIYAVLCTQLFGELELSKNYFGRLDYSLWTLFDMMTMSWGSVARECMHEIWWAWLPFCSFITITGFMVFNLVIAIVCDAVSALERKDALTGEIDIKGMLSGEISEDEIVSNNVKNPNSVSAKSPNSVSDESENNEEEILDYLEDQAANLSESQKETHALLELLSLEISSLQQRHSHLSEDDTDVVNERVVAGDPVSSTNWIHRRPEENTDALNKMAVAGGAIAAFEAVRRRPQDNSGVVDTLVVEGSGMSSVNGVYDRCGSHDGAPMYSKAGSREGVEVEFKIYRHTFVTGKGWYISALPNGKSLSGGDEVDFYYAFSGDSDDFPSRDEWIVMSNGVPPAPHVYSLSYGIDANESATATQIPLNGSCKPN